MSTKIIYTTVAAIKLLCHSSKESYRLYKNDYETEKQVRAQQKFVDPLMNKWKNE
jgi:hypothetical protein